MILNYLKKLKGNLFDSKIKKISIKFDIFRGTRPPVQFVYSAETLSIVDRHLNMDPSKRPTIDEIAIELEGSLVIRDFALKLCFIPFVSSFLDCQTVSNSLLVESETAPEAKQPFCHECWFETFKQRRSETCRTC